MQANSSQSQPESSPLASSTTPQVFNPTHSADMSNLIQAVFFQVREDHLIEVGEEEQKGSELNRQFKSLMRNLLGDVFSKLDGNQQATINFFSKFDSIKTQEQINIYQQLFLEAQSYEYLFHQNLRSLFQLCEQQLKNDKGAVEVCDQQTVNKCLQMLNFIDQKSYYHPNTNFFQGLGFQLMKQYQSAIAYYKKNLQIHPSDTKSWFLMGECFRQLNMYEQSIDSLKYFIEIDRNIEKKKLFTAYQYIGEGYGIMKKYIDSAYFYRRALEIDPNHIDVILTLAHVLGLAKEFNQSFQLLEKAAKIAPSDYRIYQALTVIYVELRQEELAIESGLKSLSLRPQNIYVQFEVAKCYYTLRKYASAEKHFKKCQQLQRRWFPLLGIGFCYLRRLLVEEAITIFDKAIQEGLSELQKRPKLGEMTHLLDMIETRTKIVNNKEWLAVLALEEMEGVADRMDFMISHRKTADPNGQIQIPLSRHLESYQVVPSWKNTNADELYQQLHEIMARGKFNPLILNIIYEEKYFLKRENPYFKLIIQQKWCYNQKIGAQVIDYYQYAVRMFYRLNDLIVVAMIYKGLGDFLHSQQYFLKIISYPIKNTQIKNIHFYDDFLRVYKEHLLKYSQKQQISVLEFIFWHFLKLDENESILIYKFMKDTFKDQCPENELQQQVLAHKSIFVSRVNEFIEKLMVKQPAIVRFIDFKRIFDQTQINIEQLQTNNKIEFVWRQRPSEVKHQSLVKIKKTLQLRIKALLSSSKSVGVVDKIEEKLFAYFIKTSKIRPQLHEINLYNSLIEEILKDEDDLKMQILELLNNHFRYNMNKNKQLEALTEKIQIKLVGYWETKYVYNQFSKFVINQFGQLLHECLAQKVVSFIDLLRNLRQTNSWKQFGEGFRKLHSFTSEQPLIQFEQAVMEEKMLYSNTRILAEEHYKQSNFRQLIVIQAESILSEDGRTGTPMLLAVNWSLAEKDDLSGFKVSQCFHQSSASISSFQNYQSSHVQSNIESSSVNQQLRSQELCNIIIRYNNKCLPFSYFRSDMRFGTFANLLLKNNYSILSIISEKKYPNIARRTILSQFTKVNKTVLQQYVFAVLKGEMQFSQKYQQNNGKDELQVLMNMGVRTVYCWLISAAQMISQIEKLGIFQADFQIRNTIKFGEIFEAIDFDYAFQTVEFSEAQSETKTPICEIIKYWLEFQTIEKDKLYFSIEEEQSQAEERQSDILINYIFKGAENSLIQRLKAIKKRISPPQQRSTLASKVTQCINLLRQYAKDSHFKQFRAICLKILNFKAEKETKQMLKLQQIRKLQKNLIQLQKSKNYEQFIFLFILGLPYELIILSIQDYSINEVIQKFTS